MDKKKKRKIIENVIWVLAFVALYFYMNPKVDFHEKFEEGVQFEQLNWNQAIAKAQREDKIIFLDLYATWCGPCKRLRKYSLTDEEVGAFYNENFINLIIDGETPEGSRLMRKYQLNSFPSLMYLAPDGSELHRELGFTTARTLLNIAKDISD